jgi:hypothetical protein
MFYFVASALQKDFKPKVVGMHGKAPEQYPEWF